MATGERQSSKLSQERSHTTSTSLSSASVNNATLLSDASKPDPARANDPALSERSKPPSPANSNTTESLSHTPTLIGPQPPSYGQLRSTPLVQQNTLVSNKLDSSQQYSSAQRSLENIRSDLLRDSAGKFTGPMKAKDFLAEFVPRPPGDSKMPNAPWKAFLASESENDMYQPFIDVCSKLDSKRKSKRMLYADTHNNSDPRTIPLDSSEFREGLKPDIVTYDQRLRPKDTRIPDFTRADRVDELKRDTTWDPFDDSREHLSRDPLFPFEAQTTRGRRTRGQICAYASAIFQLQFRFFFFSTVVMKTHARLIRWERAGAIVTEAFEVASTEYLAEFIWRYSYMSLTQRGFDESIRPASDLFDNSELAPARSAIIAKEEEKAPETKGKHAERQTCLLYTAPRTNTENVHVEYPRNAHGKLSRVSFSVGEDAKLGRAAARPDGGEGAGENMGDISDIVPREGQTRSATFILLSPLFIFDRSPFAKGTRSFVIYHTATKALLHLKDTQRVSGPEYIPEHEILEELRNANVQRIPTVDCAWDVAPHGECYDTVFGTFFDKFNKNKRQSNDYIVRRAQRVLRPYRLITREVARELTAFENWREVSVVLYDVLGVLKYAEKANWRHRDISVGNIMIYNKRGFLIDWELAQRPYLLNERKPRAPDHTGTWQYISTGRLLDPVNTLHLAMDDMESTFWAFLWVALRFGNHPLPSDSLQTKLRNIFDYVAIEQGLPTGGIGKHLIMKTNPAEAMPTKFIPGAINYILRLMQKALRPRYVQPSAPEASPLDDDDVKATEQRRYQDDLEWHEKNMAHLADPTYLRSLIKTSTAKNWSGDSGPIRHELLRLHNAIRGPSAAKRKHPSRGNSAAEPFPDAKPPDRVYERDEERDGDEDEEEARRPLKKRAAARGLSASGIAALDTKGKRARLRLQPQPQLYSRSVDPDEDEEADDGEVDMTMTAGMDVVGTAGIEGDVEHDLGLTSDAGSPPPPSSAAPSSPSSAYED